VKRWASMERDGQTRKRKLERVGLVRSAKIGDLVQVHGTLAGRDNGTRQAIGISKGCKLNSIYDTVQLETSPTLAVGAATSSYCGPAIQG